MKKQIPLRYLFHKSDISKIDRERMIKHQQITQGYMNSVNPRIRVRIESESISCFMDPVGFLAVDLDIPTPKEKQRIKSQETFRLEISTAMAKKLLKSCGTEVIRKTVYLLDGWTFYKYRTSTFFPFWVIEKLSLVNQKGAYPDWWIDNLTPAPRDIELLSTGMI